MTFVNIARYAALTAAGLLIVNCSSLPDDPGLYAVDASGDVQRLSGGPKWERKTWEDRSDLPPNLRFFIVHPDIAADATALSNSVRLRRAGWVRSDIQSSGAISPAGSAQWVAAEIETLNIPLDFERLGKRDDIIAAAPRAKSLNEGLYVMELKRGDINIAAKFGVNWSDINKTDYATKYCIDRYHSQDNTTYRRCYDQQQALATHGLQLHMVEPERRIVGGRPAIVVKGIVLNKSDSPRAVPMLEGRLIDGAGRTVHDWRFRATMNEVAPGKSVSFGAIVEGAPQNVANIVVRFTETAASVQ